MIVSRRKTRFGKFFGVAFLAATVGGVGIASASPLLNVVVLGNTNGSSNYGATVTAAPGQTIYYELEASIAPPGITNNDGDYGPGLVTGTQTSGSDGVNALNLTLANTTGAALSTPTVASSYTVGTGYTPGVASGSTVKDIFAIASPGVFYGGTSPVQVLTGSFIAGSSSGLLEASYDTVDDSGVGFKYNDAVGGQTPLVANDQTETLSGATASGNLPFDPLVGFTPLRVTSASPVPEPSSVAIMGLASGLLFLRRRRNA